MHKLLLPVLVLAVGGGLAAQDFDLSGSHGIVRDAAGTPWAVGAAYKARVTDDAVTFVPALGEAAPGNSRLTLRLQSVRRGEATTWQRTTATRGAVHTEADAITIARDTFVERYDARADGLEQSFVFAERQRGSGDLVVRCELDTPLQPQWRADGTLWFHDGRTGGVTFGSVVGIDAAGRRCAGALQVQDGALDLRLPAWFVDGASYPLVLDPLIGTAAQLSGSSQDCDQQDAAYSAADDDWLVVWRRTYNATDADIFGQRIDGNGALVGGTIGIAFNIGLIERAPKVCYVRSRNRHVVAWFRGSAPIGPWEVVAGVVASGVPGATVTVNGSLVPNGKQLALAGDNSVLGTKALLVFATAYGASVFGQELTILRTSTLELSPFGSLSASAPADLSSTLGHPTSDTYSLVRSRDPAGITALAVLEPGQSSAQFVYALDYNGAYLGQRKIVSTVDPAREPVAAIDGDGTDFVVGYRNFDGHMQARQLTWDGSTFTSGITPTTLSTNPGSTCAVGFLGERFLVAWSEQTSNPFDSDLFGVSLKPDCSICSQTFAVASVARPNTITPVVAPTLAGGGAAGEALLTWSETDTLPPWNSVVCGRRFEAMVGAPPVALSTGCGNGGTATAVGAFAPGNENFKFKLTGGDPTAPFALISLSLGGPSILCGCELTNPIVLEPMLAFAGTASYAFVPWCDPSYLGTPIEFQWLLYGAAASPCPFVPNLAASSRGLVTLQP